MERRTLGQTGMSVSILGFGGAEIGYGRAAQATVDRLLGEALDAGLNVIDTAECYLTSEALIGRAVSHRRQEVYLLTKCGHASGLPLPDWDPRLLTQSIERSLQRLRTDYVDVVQLHSCAIDVLRRDGVIDALRRARAAGKTRYLGYSGDGEAARYAIACGAFDTLQTSINLADQEAIALTLPLARARGMGVIAKRPLANVAWRHGTRPDDPYIWAYWERLRRLDYDFLGQEVSEAVGVALRFTLSVDGVHTAIVGSARAGRWRQNAALLAAGPLAREAFEAIRARWQERAGADWHGEE
ncbi:MAG TPA: aldo/keto reductase [Chloroflexota bacterium]|nr:aldo/keto reductase [Chloroflexota bacterium]